MMWATTYVCSQGRASLEQRLGTARLTGNSQSSFASLSFSAAAAPAAAELKSNLL
jgi:hypothetical protein